METYRLVGLMILVLLSSSVEAESKQEKSPLAHVNLSPFQAWRSAYECIINAKESHRCSPEDKLTMKGEIFVTKEETSEYCKKEGCGEHIQSVLTCIHHAKRDFWFANKATVRVLQDAISNGCKNSIEINTSDYEKSAANQYQSFPKLLMLTLPTVLLMLIFNL